MAVTGYVVATITAMFVYCSLFCIATTFVARCFGQEARQANIGMGPTLFTWRGRRAQWCIRAFPIRADCDFSSEDEDADESSDTDYMGSMSMSARITTALAGQLLPLAFGIALLSIAVAAGREQLVLSPDVRLVHDDAASSYWGQTRLCWRLVGQYLECLIPFRSAPPWGGGVALIVTLGRTGAESSIDWATLLGVLMTAMALVNLLPIPPFPGFQIVEFVVAACMGLRRVPDNVTRTTIWLVAFVAILGLYLRIFYLDFRWICNELGIFDFVR